MQSQPKAVIGSLPKIFEVDNVDDNGVDKLSMVFEGFGRNLRMEKGGAKLERNWNDCSY